jgi:heme exporter protein B
MKRTFFKAVFAIARKDLQAEIRSRELIGAMGLFALLSVLVFSFALELDRLAREEAVGGVLWVTVVFASTLGLNRSLAMERDQGNLDAMLLAPIAPTAIYFGKLIGNLLFTLVVGLMLLPLMTILYNITLVRLELVIGLMLGTVGITTAGTLLATMTVQTRARETLLPIVMLPVVLPVLLAAVRATSGIIAQAPSGEWAPWLQLLAGIDLIYITLCALLFDYVVEG